MTKVKYLIVIILTIIALLLIPNFSNAATSEYTDTNQGVEWTYELDDNNNVINLRLKTTTKTGTIEVPSSIEGKTVISLGDDSKYTSYLHGAFYQCSGITGVTIPNTIVTIGEGAFRGCTGLRQITLPDSVTKIGDYAFYGCYGMSSITLSKNITTIGVSAFYGCTGLKQITLPENLSTISNYTFSNCSGISNITFSENITNIGEKAFSGCSSLKKLTIPDSVTTINEGAFKDCSGLTEVDLPKNLGKINSEVFSGCSGLTSIKIPEGVTTIGDNNEWSFDGAFYKCTALKKVLIPDSVVSISKYTFEQCTKLTIYGNDGMTSKEYAEEHDIPFDYIANWDESSSGKDIAAPIIENIQVTHASVSGYYDENSTMYVIPTGKNLIINVNFNEEIVGTTAPTLIIKFGNGQNIEIKEGTIAGKTITYTYTIQNTDNGIMTAVDLKDGDIKDLAGNVANLSCPTLEIQYSTNSKVYANGTVTTPDDVQGGGDYNPEDNNGETPEDPNQEENPGEATPQPDDEDKPSNGNTNNGDSSKQEDDTTIKGTLPATGVNYVIVIVIALIAILGIIMYVKVKEMKEIK